VKPAPFAYHRPAALGEAFDLLDRYGDDARILAGGQSLVPALNMRLATPAALVDINRLPGLAAIRAEGGDLAIGALARHEAVERSPLVATRAPLLAAAMPHVGHVAIRSRGTIGGSLALADPAAELPACAVALDATIVAARRDRRRSIPAAEFFRGVYSTALEPGEILAEVVIPVRPGPAWRWHFDELARRHGDFALAGIAALARLEGGAIHDLRLVFFGVGAAPVRARAAERALMDAAGKPDAMDAARRALDGDLDPPGDVHGSPALRRHLAGVLLGRAIASLTGVAR
jgi:carbon-monoxide dehydrogenase medium subunit